MSPTFSGCPQHFQEVPNIFRLSPTFPDFPTFSGCPQHFQDVPNIFRLSPTFPDFPTFWDQKIDIGAGGPLTPKKIINFLDFWTLIKPKLKLTPVSESAGKIQSHGGSGRPSCWTNPRFLIFQIFLGFAHFWWGLRRSASRRLPKSSRRLPQTLRGPSL